MVHVPEANPGGLEAVADRRRREPRRVLHPVEPLLFDGRDQLAVGDQGRRGVPVIGVKAEDVQMRTWVELAKVEAARDLARGYYPVVWTNRKYRMIYFNMGHNDIDYEHKYDTTNRTLSYTLNNPIQDQLIIDALLWLGDRR